MTSVPCSPGDVACTYVNIANTDAAGHGCDGASRSGLWDDFKELRECGAVVLIVAMMFVIFNFRDCGLCGRRLA